MSAVSRSHTRRSGAGVASLPRPSPIGSAAGVHGRATARDVRLQDGMMGVGGQPQAPSPCLAQVNVTTPGATMPHERGAE